MNLATELRQAAHYTALDHHRDLLERAAARIRQLEQVERRFNWIRDQHWVEPEACFRLGLSSESEDNASVYEDELNAAIDAALSTQGEKT